MMETMTSPFLLVQLSDLHVGGDWAAADPVAGVAAAVRSVLEMPARPDAVLVSGDLADHATDAEYGQVLDLLSPLRVPLYVLPGNHDDRAALRRHFEVPGSGAEPVRYSVGLGPLRLVVLDTTLPGEDPGGLDAVQLAWLDAELDAEPGVPTLVAMHHPPLSTGIPACDEVGLAAPDRVALGEVLGRHDHVRCVVGGHVHRAITGRLAGRTVFTVPSTYVQTRLTFASDEIVLAEDEPAGFGVHAVVDGDVVSHVQPVC
jgi:Icc protein